MEEDVWGGHGRQCFYAGSRVLTGNPAIIVVAYNRPGSLHRLLGSLARAEYPCHVELIISIDHGGSDEVVRVAEDFRWSAGSKEIIRRKERMGLRKHILACGDLSDLYGSVIVLEDDLYVSPVFYLFALQAVSFYGAQAQIGGIGLYAYRVIRSTPVLFEPLADGMDVVFLQYACSWGQVWTAQQWRSFRAWYAEAEKRDGAPDVIPAGVAAWPETSWLKYYIRFLVETNRYFVYPRESLTTCFQEAGQHYRRATANCHVALQLFKREFRLQHLEESNCVYDAWQTIVPDRLNRLVPQLAEYDYVIDFYGHKSLSSVSSPYMLTCRSSQTPILEFGSDMRPLEMNIIENARGTDIVLARKTDVEPRFHAARQLIRVYPELGGRRLLEMARLRASAMIRDCMRSRR